MKQLISGWPLYGNRPESSASKKEVRAIYVYSKQ